MEVGAHAAEVEVGAFGADLEDEFVGGFVDKGARVVDPAAEGGSVGWGGVVDEGDAGLADVFEADDDFGFSA